MPQISESGLAQIFIEISDDETECSSKQRILSGNHNDIASAANAMGIHQIQEANSNIAEHCDKLPISAVLLETFRSKLATEKRSTKAAETHSPQNCNRTIESDICAGKNNKSKITYSCHRCSAIFATRIAFESHYKQSYDEPPVYTCQICEKQMKNKRSYQRHYNRHASPKEFKCLICAKSFAHEKLFKQHNLVHNLTTAKCCADCEREFFDLFEFKAHCRTHHDQKKKQQTWECEDCGKIMKNRSSLSMHMKIHNNDRQFGCMICDQKFVQKINLINHVKAHNAIKTHSCDECGKSFVGQSQLLRHHTYHTNVRSFECEICKKMYKTKRDLKLHLMVHSVQRPHKCSSCDKTFLSTSKLKQHYNIHTGSRPYKCEYCPKDFTNFPNWLKHTRRRHKVDHKTGEKLIVMPKFLNKVKKTSVSAAGAAAASAAAGVVAGGDTKPEKAKKKRESTKKVKLTKNIDDMIGQIKRETPLEIIDDHRLVHKEPNEPFEVVVRLTETNTATNNALPTITTANSKCTDLSTITVNDRTLPLNTSDDLERAASLLMQQTLDLEDDIEFVNIKSESIDASLYQSQFNFHDTSTNTKTQNQCSDFDVMSMVDCHPNIHYTDPMDSDLIPFLYYPQTQCDFAMMPLPPINTVKSQLKCIDPSTHIYSTTANVL